MTDQARSDEGSKALREKVERVLDTIRPYIQGDGGNIELVSVADDGVVQVRLTGACVGCMHAQMTLKAGVERMLKQEIPEIRAVEAAPF